jgi:predicted amidohydrolase
MTPPDDKLTTLCRLVVKLVGAGACHEALAYASLAICWVDSGQYANLIAAAGLDLRAVAVGAAAIDDAFDNKHKGLMRLMAATPLSMLHWLAQRINQQLPDAPHTYRTEGYPVDVFTYAIAPTTARRLGFPAYWSKIFLWPNADRRNLRARVAMQGLSRQRFAPCWHVMPDVPDQNQRTRTIEVAAVNGPYSEDCLNIRERGRMRIYVVEFATAPVFVGQLSGSGNNCWSALALANETAMIEEALRHLGRAAETRADVVIFPELTVSPQVKQAIADAMAARMDSSVSLVIAGSFHEATGAGLPAKNVTCALDRFGNAIQVGNQTLTEDWRHEKQNPVILAGADGELVLRENLQPGSKLMLVHTPLGLQGIVNCLDLAQAAAISTLRLELIPTSLLWVPSMSATVSAHLAHAATLRLNHNTIVICSNQSIARFSEQHFIDQPAGQSFVLAASENLIDIQSGYGPAQVFDIRL